MKAFKCWATVHRNSWGDNRETVVLFSSFVTAKSFVRNKNLSNHQCGPLISGKFVPDTTPKPKARGKKGSK